MLGPSDPASTDKSAVIARNSSLALLGPDIPFESYAMRPNNLFLSIPQAARLLGKGPAAVRRAVQRGDLAAVKVPGCQPRVPAAAVAELLEAARRPSPLRFAAPSDEVSVRLVEPVGS